MSLISGCRRWHPPRRNSVTWSPRRERKPEELVARRGERNTYSLGLACTCYLSFAAFICGRHASEGSGESPAAREFP